MDKVLFKVEININSNLIFIIKLERIGSAKEILKITHKCLSHAVSPHSVCQDKTAQHPGLSDRFTWNNRL